MMKIACASIFTGVLLLCSAGCTTQTHSVASNTYSVDGSYTTKDIKHIFPVGTPIATYVRKKEELQLKHATSIALPDGNIGKVLEATDGFVVICGNDKGIFDLLEFQTLEEVKSYEKSLNLQQR
ncbi:hypothetical protein COD86_09805 [Bacillus cereus]|nr:hypothetical protein COD14_15840 [Bacillus cereus]PGV96553.1 hypothetical protein COD86_09805 [Bacillus cereus]